MTPNNPTPPPADNHAARVEAAMTTLLMMPIQAVHEDGVSTPWGVFVARLRALALGAPAAQPAPEPATDHLLAAVRELRRHVDDATQRGRCSPAMAAAMFAVEQAVQRAPATDAEFEAALNRLNRVVIARMQYRDVPWNLYVNAKDDLRRLWAARAGAGDAGLRELREWVKGQRDAAANDYKAATTADARSPLNAEVHAYTRTMGMIDKLLAASAPAATDIREGRSDG